MKDQRILVIAEKADIARKIAEAISITGRPIISRESIEVPNAYNGKHYIICSAFGHLYELIDSQGNREISPSLDVDWFPRNSVGKDSFGRYSRTKFLIEKRLKHISLLAKEASIFVNACDFDSEGDTIGSNILQYSIRDRENIIWRAKFSTLAPDEIRSSFSSLFPAETSLANAGRLRHLADFVWGVNLSRALTIASHGSNPNLQKSLTIGRVQGPTLSFVVDREIERLTHVPRPYWSLACTLEKQEKKLITRFLDSPIHNEKRAKEIHELVSHSKFAILKKLEKSLVVVPPSYPFDLGELQSESFRLFNFSPKITLSIAQKLYQDALISYPRTESQKLPQEIGFANIFQKLSTMRNYSTLISKLQANPKKRISPLEGPRDDPAHPAIYPTGESPNRILSAAETKIFDLVIRRFCNSFSPNALLEKIRGIFDIASFDFEIIATSLVEEGWTEFYPYGLNIGSPVEVSLSEGEEFRVKSVSMNEHYRKMPGRFTEGSLLQRMESEQIGTKATRAETIATLIDRRYLSKLRRELVPSVVAINLVEMAREKCPEILSVQMTRELEKKLDHIRKLNEDELSLVEKELAALRSALTSIRKTEFQVGSFIFKKTAYKRGGISIRHLS